MTFWMEARMGKIAIAASLFAVGCMAEEDTKSDIELNASDGQADALAATSGTTIGGAFTVTNLTADTREFAPDVRNVDPNLVNAWGLVPFERMFFVVDEATGVLSILDGGGRPSTGTPKSGEIKLEEGITGIAATGVSSKEADLFQIHEAGACKPARLIVSSESGKLFAVNPDVSTTRGFVVVDRSKAGAIYKGVTVLQREHGKRGPLILAADFRNARIDVFDANFSLVKEVSFEARGLARKGFAPFNVAALDDTVYVTYAKQNADKDDEVVGAGLGFVAAFRSNGQLRRLVTGSELNAPWAMVLAHDFGSLRRSLLVGNFGDGHITALDPVTLKIRGQLRGPDGKPIAIEGLWGLSFADDVRNARSNGLYFAAGPEDETHGLFGVITPSRRCDKDDCGTH